MDNTGSDSDYDNISNNSSKSDLFKLDN